MSELSTPAAEASVGHPDRAGAPLHIAVARTVDRWQHHLLDASTSPAATRTRAVLARLRRIAGSEPEAHPLAFQEALDALSPQLSEDDLGRTGFASATERAAFHAVTLFAVHAQSMRATVHVPDRSFGRAVGMLVAGSDSGSLKPRFDALMAARSSESRLVHARSLITLLRGASVGFDYGKFARDLRTLGGPHRNSVLLRWGRDIVVATHASSAEDSGPQPQA